jgi:hypothetical protein
MIRTLHFEHEGKIFRIEVQDYGDSESSDTVEVYGPGDELLSSYDTCARSRAGLITEARREIDA